MSLGDWGAIEGSQRAASAGPVTLATPGAANTKSAWTQLLAATPFDAVGVLVTITAATINGAVLLDLGLGAAGSEQVLVPNLQTRRLSGATGAVAFFVPVAIPAGVRIAARYQGASASISVGVHALLLAAAWNTPLAGSRVAACGANAATSAGAVVDPGSTANSKGAWVELAAAADFDAQALLLSVQPSATLLSTATWLIDVAIGPAGSEQILLPDVSVVPSGNADTIPWRIALPIAIPAGSRVAVRAQCSSTTTPGREREIVAHLIG